MKKSTQANNFKERWRCGQNSHNFGNGSACDEWRADKTGCSKRDIEGIIFNAVRARARVCLYFYEIHVTHYNGEQEKNLLLNSVKRQRQKQTYTEL
jgi:hypothetical protein